MCDTSHICSSLSIVRNFVKDHCKLSGLHLHFRSVLHHFLCRKAHKYEYGKKKSFNKSNLWFVKSSIGLDDVEKLYKKLCLQKIWTAHCTV